jgi:hypothetical protein
MQAGDGRASDPGPDGPSVRFEATVHRGERLVSLDAVADLDLDRVPDPEGAVRVLISAEDAQRLVAQGFEVRLVNALEVKPLDAGLVLDDDTADAWFDEQTKGVERQGDS